MGQVADLWAAIGLEMQEAKWKKADNLLDIVAGRVKQLAINSALATTDVNKAMDVIGFKMAPKATNKFLGDAKKAGDPSAFAKLGGAIKGAALAYVGLQGAQMAWGGVEKTLDIGGRLDDLSQQTGIAAESLQRYGYAAKLGGSSLESLVGGVKKFNQGFVDAAKTGKGPVADGLRAIGLSVADVRKEMKTGGLDGAVKLVSSRLAALPDGGKKAAAAMDIFGKTGSELIPTINGLADAMTEADELGLVMSNEDVKALADAGDEIDKVKASFEGVRNQLVIALLPGIRAVTDGILGWYKANKAAINEKIVNIVKVLGAGFQAMKPVLESIGAVLGFIADNWKIFAFIAKASMLPLIGTFKLMKFLMGGLPGLFNAIGSAAVAVANAIKNAFWSVVEFFKTIGSAISDAFHAALDWIIDKVEAVIDGVKWAVNEAKKIADIPGEIWDSLTGPIDPESMQRFFGVPAPTAVSPAGEGGNAFSIGELNVTSPNADPKQVADLAVAAFEEKFNDELRKATN